MIITLQSIVPYPYRMSKCYGSSKELESVLENNTKSIDEQVLHDFPYICNNLNILLLFAGWCINASQFVNTMELIQILAKINHHV